MATEKPHFLPGLETWEEYCDRLAAWSKAQSNK